MLSDVVGNMIVRHPDMEMVGEMFDSLELCLLSEQPRLRWYEGTFEY